MSHIVIIGTGTGKPGGRQAEPSAVSVTIEWSPSHDLTPAQERKTIEKLEKLVEKAEAIVADQHEE